MSIRSDWKGRKIRRQSAAWHTRISKGMSEAQRRAFELWIAEPPNAREFRAQRVLIDGVVELKGRPGIPSAAQLKFAKPPATRFVSALRCLLTENAYARIVAPLVAQEQHEYYEAIRCGNEKRARWVEGRLYLLLIWIVLRAIHETVARLLGRI